MRNVQVLGIGHLAAAVRLRLRAELREAAEPEEDEPLIVVCSDFPNLDSFRDANLRALRARSPILFVQLAAPTAVRIGPLVCPGRPGCFECVRARRLDVTHAARGPDPVRYAQIGAGLVVRQIRAVAVTPYKGTLGVERRLPRHRAGCRTCGARA
jgi:hypothetical protein